MKLYALRTTDTKEWVRFNGLPSKGYAGHFVYSEPSVYNEKNDDVKRFAETETGHPCHWVEVQVIEAKPVTEEVMDDMNDFGAVTEDPSDNCAFTWASGFRAACEYFGIKIQEDEK